MGTKQKQKQEIQTITTLQDFLSLLPRVNITNYSVLIDGRNFYDHPINDLTKQYHDIRNTSRKQGDDYTQDDICQIISTSEIIIN